MARARAEEMEAQLRAIEQHLKSEGHTALRTGTHQSRAAGGGPCPCRPRADAVSSWGLAPHGTEPRAPCWRPAHVSAPAACEGEAEVLQEELDDGADEVGEMDAQVRAAVDAADGRGHGGAGGGVDAAAQLELDGGHAGAADSFASSPNGLHAAWQHRHLALTRDPRVDAQRAPYRRPGSAPSRAAHSLSAPSPARGIVADRRPLRPGSAPWGWRRRIKPDWDGSAPVWS
eukprot:4520229-Prymnesium_polylepis.1